MSDVENGIVCFRVEDTPKDPGYTILGSTPGLCPACSSAIMIAPSSREQMRQRPDAIVRCVQCFLAVCDKDDVVEIYTSDSQTQELGQRAPTGTVAGLNMVAALSRSLAARRAVIQQEREQ